MECPLVRNWSSSFKSFLAAFPEIYPCPYCRHHMVTYVMRNREPDLYPLEWTLMGL